MAVVFDEFDSLAKEVLKFNTWPKEVKTIKDKRLYLRQIIEHYRKTKIPNILHQFLNEKQLFQLQQLEQLERLEKLQQLEKLEQLEQLEQLETSSLDYREIKIMPNSIVYCDIPYKGTAKYTIEFNHEEFFDWAATRNFPVYVSEYCISDKRFECIYSCSKSVKLSQKGALKENVDPSREKLYWNKAL